MAANSIRKVGKRAAGAGSKSSPVVLDGTDKVRPAAVPNGNGPNSPPPLLTEFDLAAYLQLSVRTVQRWRITGDGPKFIKLRAMIRYRVEDVAAWCAEQARSSTAG
jgi:hypothetical protein